MSKWIAIQPGGSWLKSDQTPGREFCLQACTKGLHMKTARVKGGGDRQDAPEIWGQSEFLGSHQASMELEGQKVTEPGLEVGPSRWGLMQTPEPSFDLHVLAPDSPLFSGVSLRSRAKGRLPIPMVILPFMKHGDLHAFLLASRIGENPFVSARHGSGHELERDKDPLCGWGGPIELVGRRRPLSLMLYANRLPFSS